MCAYVGVCDCVHVGKCVLKNVRCECVCVLCLVGVCVGESMDVYGCMYVCVYVYMCMYIYIYIYIYIYLFIYLYVPVYVYVDLWIWF